MMGRFDDSAIVIDLSGYEAGQKLKPYVDAGATHFIFRMWYQGQYVYDNWMNREDAAYRAWYDEAKGLGAKVGGYALYCAGVDDQDYERSEVILDGIGEVMSSGYKPDFLFIDDEINRWYQSGKMVTATAVNQVKGLRILIDKCWKRFKLVTGHYSRVSFIRDAGYTNEYTTWLDNVNRDGKVVPNWWAVYKYYRQPVTMTSLREFVGKLTYPTSTFENNYLQLGSYALWDLWQLAGDVSTPYGKCDISISRLPLAQFNALFNLGETPQPEPEPEPETGDLAALAARVTALEAWARGISYKGG